ncbi:hypothetical protein M501DRAFT_514256 [Patellaria atrata CBS 101060]|uniref:Uncharacterized protein n=1 Tax=Patellaria atrata CBS 101060 TaxID=1346257 RepID=A0A9P4VLZ7_9PEZI|nr:hypothetical protein M501DRAFT_514256 [Patellaria atrata CBS 101060]
MSTLNLTTAKASSSADVVYKGFLGQNPHLSTSVPQETQQTFLSCPSRAPSISPDTSSSSTPSADSVQETTSATSTKPFNVLYMMQQKKPVIRKGPAPKSGLTDKSLRRKKALENNVRPSPSVRPKLQKSLAESIKNIRGVRKNGHQKKILSGLNLGRP